MMDVSGVGFPSEVPWKKMSAEELENQYCPSRWVVRLGAEESLRTYSQIGIEALPFFLFFHGGYWQSGRHPGPDGRPGDPQHCVCPEAVSKQRTLCQGEWKASFEELHDVDHFEIIENLTQKDNVLTQIILKTIFQ
ncbi:kynurenine formamidase isoform X15 [Symphalangus syndactylus]|uniref:kynurenine formamidase isoform X15 n=1 Tax=Symphalangus syndactylus TaxID=9590 RepID=UPI00300575CE